MASNTKIAGTNGATPKISARRVNTAGPINMATGASTADLGVILIDARLGVLQQSRRHAFIASLLGIPHLFVCVNKMDVVDYEQARFEEIQVDFANFSKGLNFSDVTYLPVSALKGDNVVQQSENMPWYRTDDGQPGTPLLELLETVEISHDSNLADLQASMHSDIMAGRPLELEALNGAVIRAGRATEIPTPINDVIYAMLKPLEKGTS